MSTISLTQKTTESSGVKKLGMLEKFIYGSGDIGLTCMYMIFSSYVMYFYTDVLLENAAIIGTVILVSRIFDGISDLIAGHYIDTHSGRWGHCGTALAKIAFPLAISLLLVFTVPNASLGIRIAYIFVTYNLFNTVCYTVANIAHVSMPSYVTDDEVSRSQMSVLKMLFAAAGQTVLASTLMPLVNLLGGEANKMAWVKAIIVLDLIGVFFIFFNVFFVKERVKNDTPPENFLSGLKAAVQNKYWIICIVFTLMTNMMLYFNLSVSVYYLNSVVNNMGLMGAYVAACNMPGVIVMFIMPFVLHKVSKKNLALINTFPIHGTIHTNGS